jgi:predicted outer membrane repeat protein
MKGRKRGLFQPHISGAGAKIAVHQRAIRLLQRPSRSSLKPMRPRFSFVASLYIASFVLLCVTGSATMQAEPIIHFAVGDGSLQSALDTVPDGGTIELAAGTYNAPAGGFNIFPGMNGITKEFTLRAAPGANVVLSGGGTSEILTFTTPKLVTFQGLTFANGFSTRQYHGGAASLDHVQANFVSCTFQNNIANPPVTGGGAFWIFSSTVSFKDCVWNNNTSMNYGGAISASNSRVFIAGARFSGNRINLPGQTEFSAGGAIHANSGSLRISNSRFENNQAGYVGGAIYALGSWQQPYSTPAMDLVVSDCLFTGNLAVKDPSGTMTAPTTGGAVMMEDQTTAHFYNCRFLNNSAKQGGAISGYRTITDIQNCVFKNNQAIGTGGSDGFGGAIFVLSDDNADASTGNGAINRPSAQLTVTDCLIQGPGGGVTSARQGGGIFAAGDLHSAYGIGMPQNGTPESNRATVTLKRVVFADLATSDGGNGTGGAMTGDFVALNVDQSIVENCSTTEHGGGFEIVRGSTAAITKTTFAHNSAGVLGGGLTMFGGQLTLSGCNFVDNRAKVSGAGGGSAVMTVADSAGGNLPPRDMTGVIENCLISNNSGGPAIYDGDSYLGGPYNRLQYNGNTFFDADPSPVFNDRVGYLSIQQFNGLKLVRADSTTTVKAAVANISSTNPAVIAALLMGPRQIATSGAPGETVPIPAYLGYAAGGGTPVLDGSAKGSTAAVVTTNSDGVHTLAVGTAQVSTQPVPATAVNISTRLPVTQGDGALIGGFIIVGPTPKRVIIRATGPSLTALGIAGALQDPILELHDPTGIIASNDNWRTTQIGGLLGTSQVVDILASTIPPSNNAEAALIATLNPGVNYTAVVRGANNGTGIAVVEVFDLDPAQNSTLANISTRGFIQTDDNVMFAGFYYLGGPGATKVVVRGIGPSLAAVGITNPLRDPMLELHDANGATVAANDDFGQSPDLAALQASGLQPKDPAEATLYQVGLPRGAYTAIARGKNSGVGVGLIEVYVFQ